MDNIQPRNRLFAFLLFTTICLSIFPQTCFAADEPSLENAVKQALENAKLIAEPLFDKSFHKNGKRQLIVPDQFPSIQLALDTADSGDSVVVMPGTYYERLYIRDGIRMISYQGDDGNSLQKVKGALTMLPRRTLRTIIDGSKNQHSPVGMFNFGSGAGRNTIIDGFTIQNLPEEDHHIPGHSHAVNIRGASPLITNCYVRDNGSTGIGNHVIYADQDKPISQRDFRYENIEHSAGAVIYRNIVANNLGRGIGCNHFASSFILGNEVFGNDESSLGERPGPGIGVKHGAYPTIVGNIVHDNPFGGIKGKQGLAQGAFPVNYPTRPIISSNVVFGNGKKQPNIACSNCGTEKQPVVIDGNVVFGPCAVGINISKESVGVITNNVVAKGCLKGVTLWKSKLKTLAGNTVKGAADAAFFISKNSEVVVSEKNTPTPKIYGK